MKRDKEQLSGTLTVLATYIMWGLLPAFWNLLAGVNSVFILSQRIIWSLVFMGVILLVTRRFGEVRQVFRNKKMLITCLISGILITINWGLYIWAVNSGHVIDASMGYFIQPVVVALVGVLAFRERPSVLEWVTFGFAMAGILFLVFRSGTVLLIALALGVTFAVYGAVKKNIPIGGEASLFMETLLMTPLALAFTVYAVGSGMEGCVGVLGGWCWLLLPACGVVTSLPLLCYNLGVKKIPFYMSGILMYINPTLQFLMGLFYFREPLDHNRLYAFIFIWVGVLFTLADKLRLMRKNRKTVA